MQVPVALIAVRRWLVQRYCIRQSVSTEAFLGPAFANLKQLQARGYNAASNSTHTNGDTYDALPPPGRSLAWLRDQVKRQFPDARTLVHDGHLHFRVPGSLPNAPVYGGAQSAGVRNPLEGITPPPPGFMVD